MFTSNQIEEIRKKLQLEGVKDSALPEAHPLTGKESIAVVQSGQNRKVGLDAFITSINNWCKADFLNLSKEGHSYTVEEAIAKTSPAKLGQVITFSNKKTGSWSIYQYTGETLEGWNDIDNWANILDTADYHFRGYFFNEELLKKNYPRPQVGDFAFIGTTLEEAVTFTCISAGNWYNTNYPALTFADKFKAVYSEDFGVFDAELEETLADRANKDAVGNVIHTYYASNKSLQETVSKEAVRAKEAEETNAKAISDETKARVSADTTLQGNIDKEATRAKQAEQANADAIKAVKETADSTKSITDAYFTEKKEFLDVIREEDVVAIYKDKTINATTNKLEDADNIGVIIIKLRGNGKLVVGASISYRAFDSLEPDGTLVNGEETKSVSATGNFAHLSIQDTGNHNYVAIKSKVSLYLNYYDWRVYAFFVVEMTQYEYDSLAPKDDAEIVPYQIDWQVNGSNIYPNNIPKTQYKISGWTGMNGTNARHLSVQLDNIKDFCVSYNPRLETLDIYGTTSNIAFFYLISNPSLEYIRFFNAFVKNLTYTCYNCVRLKTIYFDNIDFGGVTFFVGSWSSFSWQCYSLTTILGSVSNIKVNISFRDSPLTRDSALVIINGLADLTGSDTQTVTFSSTTKALLTEEDKNLITSKNWTLA